ncbi:TPA: type II toxin-antitoxin system Phd/YefM family antitoxin [Elizabethkingia anophelis]|nr:type II toxin-antitoxin system Phd/YefM family antitoxin [Elizabethkingia anophelis]HAT3997864.1 type II toxin-antitoxin system Phd/YefM family antitoxin [Elizabethkingia anophelis]HAT4005465.1 type II toxin-antitoxin system Phd/YefM family antitoxin [Elizabethkingia anophelis]
MIIVPLSRFKRSINKYVDLAENETVMITINRRPSFVIKPIETSEGPKKNPREGWPEQLRKANSLEDKETFFDDF